MFGWSILILLLIVLFGPLYIFSNFNPIASPNTVKSLEMTLGIKIKDT